MPFDEEEKHSAATSSPDEKRQAAMIATLLELSQFLQRIEMKSSSTLSHYRDIPESVSSSYELFQQGAALVHATSTKYTLLGKIEGGILQQTQVAQDLIVGCQHIATAILALSDDSTGCCRSAKMHARQHGLAILTSVVNLIRCFVEDEQFHLRHPEEANARTGAVWECCGTSKTMPKGNRNAIRRDLLRYVLDCNETMNEFQDLLDLSAMEDPRESVRRKNETSDDCVEKEYEWQDEDEDDRYDSLELPVATACVFLVKCSRGCLNWTLQVLEILGENQEMQSPSLMDLLDQLAEQAKIVGDGMTDLGATLYPPISPEEVIPLIESQSQSIVTNLDLVEQVGDLLSPELVEMRNKLRTAACQRKLEALEAMNDLRPFLPYDGTKQKREETSDDT
jgi:hypothetical protein